MLKNNITKNLFQCFSIAIFCGLLFCACGTHRSIIPTLNVSPRTGLTLTSPVVLSVFDARVSDNQMDIVTPLKNDLTKIYGQAIEWGEYFEKPRKGRVSVRLRVVTLGASFGSRLIASSSFASAISNAKMKANFQSQTTDNEGYWYKTIGEVEGSSSSQQLITSGSFSGEGWWNGAAWVDLEIYDLRGNEPINLVIPIAGEHREFNMWGYASGDKAAKEAWDKVSIILTRVLDSLLFRLRNEQT